MLKQEAFEAILNLNTLGGTQIQLKNASYQEGFIEGKVTELTLTGDGDLANIIDCYESTGIWTTGCVTSISRDNLGTTEYKVNGRIDEDNNVWVVDVGTICLLTGKVSYLDTLLPIDKFGRFKSRAALPAGLKVAALKKITATECTEVDIAYGYLQNGQILRTYPKLSLEFTAEDQSLDLEQLCVGLIPLILSNYQYSSDNLIQFSNLLTLDPYKEKILTTTLNRLVGLVDTVSNTNRIGSIPQTITTYLTSDHIYGSQADYNRANQTITISDCIDVDCLPTETNLLLTSRAVSNKAIAWVLYVLCLYSKTRQVSTYDNYINLIAEYLKDQINYSENLVKVGWTDSLVYEESEQLETLNFDTSAITAIAFLKLFELKGGITYLDLVTDIYSSIYSNFFREDFFVQVKESDTSTLESLTYGLIFTEFFKDYQQQDQLRQHFETLIIPNYGKDKERFVYEIDELIPITGGYQFETYNLLTEANIILNNYNLSYFNFNAEMNLTSISFYCSLVTQFLSKDSSFQLEETLNTFKDTLEAISVASNLYYYSSNLLEDAFYNYDLTFIPSELVKESVFNRSRILSKLKSWIPTEFNWFSKAALESGNTSTVLKVLSSLTAGVTTQIDLEVRPPLNKHGIELPSFLTKTQINYISSRPEGSLSGFNFLRFLGIPTVIKEPYKEVLGFAGSEVFNSSLGFGYLSGSIYSPGVCEVFTGQPIDVSNEKLIEAVQAPGIKYEVTQTIPLLIPNLLVEDINVVAIENTTCTIVTADNKYIEATSIEFREGLVCKIGESYTAALSVSPNFNSAPNATATASFNIQQFIGSILPISSFVLDDFAFIVKPDFNVASSYVIEGSTRTITIPSDALIIYDGNNPNYASGSVDDALTTNYVFNGQTYSLPGGGNVPLSTAILGVLNLGVLGQPHNTISLREFYDRGYVNNGVISFKIMHVSHGAGAVNLTINVPACSEQDIASGTTKIITGCSTEISVATWRVNNTDRFNNTDRIDA